MVGPLGALVAIALHRDAVQAEAVETAALRRSDDVKTALLRAVSHDLRTPLTAILAAGHALGTDTLTGDERAELSSGVVDAAGRLATLVDKLLDLSKLQAGSAVPRPDWVSLEEVLMVARESLGEGASDVRLTVEPGDTGRAGGRRAARARVREPARERAPLLGRPAGGGAHPAQRLPGCWCASSTVGPASSRPSASGSSSRSIAATRPPASRGRAPGSGLAIAKGFIEANGGTISVQSLPGQGTSFVVSLPVHEAAPVQAGV